MKNKNVMAAATTMVWLCLVERVSGRPLFHSESSSDCRAKAITNCCNSLGTSDCYDTLNRKKDLGSVTYGSVTFQTLCKDLRGKTTNAADLLTLIEYREKSERNILIGALELGVSIASLYSIPGTDSVWWHKAVGAFLKEEIYAMSYCHETFFKFLKICEDTIGNESIDYCWKKYVMWVLRPFCEKFKGKVTDNVLNKDDFIELMKALLTQKKYDLNRRYVVVKVISKCLDARLPQPYMSVILQTFQNWRLYQMDDKERRPKWLLEDSLLATYNTIKMDGWDEKRYNYHVFYWVWLAHHAQVIGLSKDLVINELLQNTTAALIENKLKVLHEGFTSIQKLGESTEYSKTCKVEPLKLATLFLIGCWTGKSADTDDQAQLNNIVNSSTDHCETFYANKLVPEVNKYCESCDCSLRATAVENTPNSCVDKAHQMWTNVTTVG